MEEVLDLEKVKDIKCVKGYTQKEFYDLRGENLGTREYFTCAYDNERFVIIRTRDYDEGAYIAFMNEKGCLADIIHRGRYLDFVGRGIDTSNYYRGALFEDKLDAAFCTYRFDIKNEEMEELLSSVHANDVIHSIYSEKFNKIDAKDIKKMTVYKQIVKDILITRDGFSEEEAERKVLSTNKFDLEEEVNVHPLIKSAISGILKYISGNSSFGNTTFQNIIIQDIIMKSSLESHALNSYINSYNNWNILTYLEEKNKDWQSEIALSALTNIYINKEEMDKYTPMELIEWQNLKNNLVVLNPILQSMKIDVSEKTLEKAYYSKAKAYLESIDHPSINDVSSAEDSTGKGTK